MSAYDEDRWERHRVQGDRLVAKVKELIHEGNVRRVVIRDDDGKVLIEVPLTIGVVGALVVPVWAAIGAIAALVAHCSIEVERTSPAREQDAENGPGEAPDEGGR